MKKSKKNTRSVAAQKRVSKRKAGPEATLPATGALPLRPYARLLTMLGDQLIRNERVALVELIKNAYDADASWVKVTFENFDTDFRAHAESKIVIEDDGVGMNVHTVRHDWANPATPVKLLAKQQDRQTPNHRVIQGEKGIGRFALLKLGRKIQMRTRTARSDQELAVTLDLSSYDENFIKDGQPLFLDALRIRTKILDEPEFIRRRTFTLGGERVTRRAHGTRIEISHLTSTWSRQKVAEVFEDLARLQSNFALAPEDREGDPDPFNLYIYRDEHHETFHEQRRDHLATLLKQNAVFKIEGRFDDDENVFDFHIDKKHIRLPLTSAELSGLAVFKEKFGKDKVLENRHVESGPFGFSFYVFDFSAEAKGVHLLDKADKQLLKKHRIYLYRDGIRVYPYGDPDDDWLQIDMRRGTVRAAEFVSNDAVTGFVTITQEDNPQLRDKTSREGLVDTGHPTDDFRSLLQIFLAWVRAYPYQQYRFKNKIKREHEVYQKQRVQEGFEQLLAIPELPAAAREVAQETQRNYQTERRYLVARAESTESLAGVGLSVEAGTHDLHLAMHSAMRTLDTLLAAAQRGKELDSAYVTRELEAVSGALGFIERQLKDLQLLFKSTKQRRKDIRITEILEKVLRLFRTILDRSKIEFELQQVGDGVLTVKTTDAVLLQLFLNLFDNATYWLDSVQKNRRIQIVVDNDRKQLVFADSGPGISADDAPYVFEPFFSGKGEDGRGLGLYIARQLLERQGFTIEIAPKNERVLKGANFLISFAPEEEDA